MLGITPCFTVSAEQGTVRRIATRKSAASAMVLADRWAAEGCKNVTVSSPEGVIRDRRAFRATLPLARWTECRRPYV